MPSYKEQFNLSIFDYSPVGYCVLELVLDDKGQPVDWIYRYCKIDDQVVHRYDAQMLNESTDEEEIKVVHTAEEKCVRDRSILSIREWNGDQKVNPCG